MTNIWIVYVQDTYKDRIMKFTNKNQFLYTVGNFFQFVYPNQVFPDGKGNIYITDTGNNRVLLITR